MSDVKCKITGDGGCPWSSPKCSSECTSIVPAQDYMREEQYRGLKLPMTPDTATYLEETDDVADRISRAAKATPFPEVTLPGISSDRATRKATPMYGGFVAYFPDAMAAVSQLSFSANEVHNPGEPLHWSKEKSSDHKDCCVRHLAESGTYDREADNDYHYLHDVKLAWRAMANLQMILDGGKAPRIKKGEM